MANNSNKTLPRLSLGPSYSPSNPAPKGSGWGVLKPEYGGQGGVATYNGPKIQDANVGDGTGGGTGGGSGPSAAEVAQAKANAAAKKASRRQNENTASLVDAQYQLLGSFGAQRDTKLANILKGLQDADRLLMENYGIGLQGLLQSKTDNEMSEADASAGNIVNAVRERQDILNEASSNGAGESDLLKAQIQALRNYNANQGEVNRSFYDTLNSVNRSISGLNSDTATSRNNLFNQSEADKESAWANYYNQTADTWTQIQNIENSNTNIDSDTSEAYTKKYADAAAKAAAAAKGSYKRAGTPSGWDDWGGKGRSQDRELTSSNRAATVNLGGKQKAPEGATLRKWN